VVNIGKLMRGQADYYLDAVARSQEEYYTGTGEAPGYWLGRAAGELGLAGEVSEEGLHRLLAGAHPLTAGRLGSPPRGARVAGFDLTFRAPKSVSLLYGLGGLDTARQVRAAHEEAIAQALDYLERHAAVVSRGHARARQEPARGLLAVAYQHRTSRAGDPLLHTHVLVANLGQGSDGRWTALDGRLLYRHAKTAGYLYQAVLRAELTRRIGVAWGPVRNGVADVRGVHRPVIEAFSQRRQQIHQRLAELGHHTARSAQAAALYTRPAKPTGISQATLRGVWHRRAVALGVTPRTLAAVLGQATARRPSQADLHGAIAHLASPQGLTLHTSTFTRRHVLQELCEALPAGTDIGVSDLERLADWFLASRFVRSVTTDSRPSWVDGDMARHRGPRFAGAGEWAYTTHELLATEAAAVAAAIGRRAQGAGVVPKPVLDQVLATHTRTNDSGPQSGDPDRPALSDEQVAMVRALATSGDGVQVVNAKAGSGKTTALRAARDAWQAAGYRVIGAALAARVARQLQQNAGIPADTIAKLLGDLDDPTTPGMSPGTVLVIDEAGMVGTRQLARLLAHAQHAGAKIVAVGDVQQLPEIQAGGLFRGLVQRLGAVQLHQNRRQRERWEQQALDLLRGGDPIAAIARYAEHGRIVVRSRQGRLRNRLVQDWWAATQRPGERPPVMIALRHADVTDLNQRARELLAEHGRLGPHPITIDRREFAVGDRIVTLRNARRLDVLNGTLATITAIDRDQRALLVRTDDGRDLVLPRWYLDSPGPLPGRRRVDHAYAITCHKAQGMTADRAFVLASDDLYKEWGYVAMSRGQLENRLYIATGDHPLADELDTPREPKPDAVLAITAALEQPRSQYLALDQVDPTAAGANVTSPPCEDLDRGLLITPPRLTATGSPALHPHRDLVSLQALHRTYTIELLHAREQLAAQQLGWRQRRRLGRTIRNHQQTLAELERQLACWNSHSPAAALSERSPATPPVASSCGNPAALQPDPPRYLVAELGGWPRTAAAQAIWRLAAARIQSYRASAGVFDPKTALGPVPDPSQRAHHDAVAELVQEAVNAIDALESPAPPDPTEEAVFLEPP
jgi:conjugative relaxase-like TrwC/TraI family protein